MIVAKNGKIDMSWSAIRQASTVVCDKKFDNKVNNFLRFAMDNFDTELVVMGIKLALTQYSLPIDPDEVECFDEFHERFGKYIQAAQSA